MLYGFTLNAIQYMERGTHNKRRILQFLQFLERFSQLLDQKGKLKYFQQFQLELHRLIF